MAKQRKVKWEKDASGVERAKVTIDPTKKPCLEGEELQRHLDSRKKGGPHKNSKDKRKKNPYKQDE